MKDSIESTIEVKGTVAHYVDTWNCQTFAGDGKWRDAPAHYCELDAPVRGCELACVWEINNERILTLVRDPPQCLRSILRAEA